MLEELTAAPRLLVVAALIFLCGDLAANGFLPYWMLVPVSVCCIAFGWALWKWKGAAALALLPTLSLLYCLWRMPGPGTEDLSRWASAKEVLLRAQVVSVLPANPPHSGRVVLSCRELLFPSHRHLSGQTMLSGPVEKLEPGCELEVTARVNLPPPALYPWDFDYARYLRRQGIFSLSYARAGGIKVLPHDGGSTGALKALENRAGSWLDSQRAHLTEVHRKFAGVPEGDLLQSMVLGDRTVKLSQDVTTRFRDLGLSHILAASGFNITVVTGVTFFLGKYAIRSTLGLNALCLTAMLFYVGLAGPSPSVVRAAMMCSLVLLSRSLYRTLYVPAALSAALLITLLIDPQGLSDVGLQLSYAATAGIIFGANVFSKRLAAIKCMPLWLAEALAVVLIAQVSVLPIQLAYFWQIGLLFLPANLLVTPLVTYVTVLGFLSSTLAILDWSGQFTGWAVALIDGAAAYPIKLMVAVVNLLSSCEQAKLHLGPPFPAAVIVYYLCFVLFQLLLRVSRPYMYAPLVLAPAICCLMYRPALPPLMLACFPDAIVCLDAQRQAVFLGNEKSTEVERFLRYYGSKIPNPAATNLSIKTVRDGVSILDTSLPDSRVLIMTANALSPAPESDRPRNGGPLNFVPPEPPQIEKLVMIVKESRPSLVVINNRGLKAWRTAAGLMKRLTGIPGLGLLSSKSQEFMLVAEAKDNGKLEWRMISPEGVTDGGPQNRN
jgi:ComEC/Rec2-related protein